MLGAKLGITSKQYNIVTDGLVVDWNPMFNKGTDGTAGLYNLANTGSLSYCSASLSNCTYAYSGSRYTDADGTDEYGTMPFGAAPWTMNTIDIWIRHTGEAMCGVWVYGADTFNSNSWSWSIAIYGTTNQSMEQYTQSNYTTSWAKYTYSVPETGWTNLTLVRDDASNDAKAYKNGVLYATSTGAGTTAIRALGDRMLLFQTGTQYFRGQVGPMKVYDRALSAGEVMQNYNATKDRYT
jgi:hypothetical protein